jgi:hypothetical protein
MLHTNRAGNKRVDNIPYIVTETFHSDTTTERKDNLQHTFDQYIRLILENGSLPTGNHDRNMVK